MSNELATISGGVQVQARYREQVDTIKQTVAKGATDAQLEMFLTLAERYALDPFLKEIWFVPGVGVVTGRDGYLKVALRDPNYDGIVSAAVSEGDHFEIDPITPTVKHTFGAKRGNIIGAYAIVFHKNRRPAVCFAPYAEYARDSSVWKTYKSAMICKVAEVLALKRQFGISGLVTEEEIGHPVAEKTANGDRFNTAQKDVLRNKGVAADAVIDAEPEHPKPWHTRKEMVAKFNAIRDLAYSLNVGTLYDGTLQMYGVDNPEKFADPNKALDCYRAIESKVMDAEVAA